MGAYIIRRVSLMIPILFLASLLIFTLVRLIPGDIIQAIQAQSISEGAIDREMLMEALGLDRPVYIQYGSWLGVFPQPSGDLSGVFQGSLGLSWWRKMSVIELVGLSWPVTLELGLMAVLVAQSIALPVGVYSALRQDKWGDYISRSFAILCISVPSFWLGTMVIVFPSIWWGYMPALRVIPFTEDPLGNLKMFIVPAIVMGMRLSGMTMRMTRTMMLEVLRQDYIRTAWAKGLRERVVIIRHALKNALIPVVTIIGIQMPVLIGGTVVIEKIFQLPGMGRLLIGAMQNRDQPLLMGLVLIFAAVLVIINLGVDLTYAYLDPRIKYK